MKKNQDDTRQNAGYRSIEGMLTTIFNRESSRFYVIEATSGRLIECIFLSQDLVRKASNCGHDRVRVTGEFRGARGLGSRPSIEVNDVVRVASAADWDTSWEWDTTLD